MDRKPTWTVVKTFDKDDILVEVSKSDAQRPRYNIRIGRQGDNGLIPFLQMFVEGYGTITVRPIADTIADLVEDAEKWVAEQAQKDENAFQASRSGRTGDRPIARPGGHDGGKQRKKSWRDRDRGERE